MATGDAGSDFAIRPDAASTSQATSTGGNSSVRSNTITGDKRMSRANNPDINFSLPLEDVNNLLTWIGEKPFNQVADLVVEMRNQVNQQIAQYQREMQQKMGGGVTPFRPNGEDRAEAS
jgi:hypothetical protein